jgi:hypothetical protein
VEDYESQVLAENPIAFATSKGAMDDHDSKDFQEAMLKEVNAHTDNEHWEVWARSDVPPGQDIIPSVWAFKHKRRIDT